MRIVTIELLNENALKLLQQLEQLDILRFVSKSEEQGSPKRKWAGSLSKETANKLLQQTEQSRSEWDRNF